MTFDLISGLHMQIQTWHPPLRLCIHAKYYVKSGLTNVLKNANKTKNNHLYSIRIANYSVFSSFAIILLGRKDMVALVEFLLFLRLSVLCVPWVTAKLYLPFPDHTITHLFLVWAPIHRASPVGRKICLQQLHGQIARMCNLYAIRPWLRTSTRKNISPSAWHAVQNQEWKF